MRDFGKAATALLIRRRLSSTAWPPHRLGPDPRERAQRLPGAAEMLVHRRFGTLGIFPAESSDDRSGLVIDRFRGKVRRWRWTHRVGGPCHDERRRSSPLVLRCLPQDEVIVAQLFAGVSHSAYVAPFAFKRLRHEARPASRRGAGQFGFLHGLRYQGSGVVDVQRCDRR